MCVLCVNRTSIPLHFGLFFFLLFAYETNRNKNDSSFILHFFFLIEMWMWFFDFVPIFNAFSVGGCDIIGIKSMIKSLVKTSLKNHFYNRFSSTAAFKMEEWIKSNWRGKKGTKWLFFLLAIISKQQLIHQSKCVNLKFIQAHVLYPINNVWKWHFVVSLYVRCYWFIGSFPLGNQLFLLFPRIH